MTRLLLGGNFERLQLVHVSAGYSRSLGEMGRFRFGKVRELIVVLVRLARAMLTAKPDILYYVPAPPSLLPVLRDLVILNATRRFFSCTVFHFHAGGVSEFEDRLPRILRPAFRRAYHIPDLAIHTSSGAPKDGYNLRARRTVIIPNGIPDPELSPGLQRYGQEFGGVILYLGLVSRAKGVNTLIRACRMLAMDDVSFKLVIAGPFESQEMKASLYAENEAGPLADRLEILGPVVGAEKWRLFSKADLFCFPSEHPSETFGLVMVEALAAGLPVVATRRRGAPEIIQDGTTGLLYEPGSSEDLATQLNRLLDSPSLCKALGRSARKRYLDDYTEDIFLKRMEVALESVCSEQGMEGW